MWDSKGGGRKGRQRWQKVIESNTSRSSRERPLCGKRGVGSHKSGLAWLSWLPGSTLGLFRWPSPSASSCCRCCSLLSVLKKPHWKRNASVGRKRSTSQFYGFLVSTGKLTDGATWPKKHDLWEEVWKTKRVMRFCTLLWTCLKTSSTQKCVI